MNMIIRKATYDIVVGDDGMLHFMREGNTFFDMPMAVCINGKISQLCRSDISDSSVTYSSKDEVMQAELRDDSVIISYKKKMHKSTEVFEVKAFHNGEKGLQMEGFDRAFCPQPRKNFQKNMDYFQHLPDISANGYYSPSILQFCIGNDQQWVSLGLLDIPDTKICKLDDDFSFLIESCGGNKVIEAGEEYLMPRVLITFPKDEWDAISVFRDKLIELGEYTPVKPSLSKLPDWWKNPIVCTYGDQLVEHRVGQKIDEAWVEEFVTIAETDWGMEKVNLIIDDSWQLPHCLEPAVDEKRFPNLRGMIDRLHERGHHVILWITPLFEMTRPGIVSRAQRLGVLSEYEFKPPIFGDYFTRFPGSYAIDYTADNAREFLRQLTEVLFGDGEGQFNADGVKLDFIGVLRDPAETRTYAHPERGIGMRELLLFYEMFYEEAKNVKSDVIIDCTAGDPRFEHVMDLNRLHDTHCGTIEKEIRAKIAALGCPGLPIDSDGALMFNEWLREHYISAAIYGIPSNYYLKKYHNFYQNGKGEFVYSSEESRDELTLSEKKKLGQLFQMVKYKPDGVPEMESFGNWILKDGNQVNGISQRGKTVVYYPTEKNGKGYIFTWQDEVIIIPLYGRKIANVTPAPKNDYLMVDYARDQAIMRITPGVIHTFDDIATGDSVDRKLAEHQSGSAGTEINYVNG